MTVIRPNGISGITSITSSGDAINFFKSDGTLGPVLGLNINATSGISTFAALNVTGVLTYEDVTSVDSVGIITARSDLSIADKIIHTGDTNTAIRFPAADTITAETSGSERLRIDGSGRVMIGNTVASSFTGNSSDNLVVGSGSGGEGITVYSATDNQGSITFADGTSGNAAYRGAVEYNHTADRLTFRTAGTGNRLIIDSSGRLLSGTTTEGHADADDLTLQAPSGYTGITLRSGTTTGGAIYFSDATSGAAEYDGQIVYSQNSRTMTFATAGVAKLTLKSDGLLVPRGIQVTQNVTPTSGNGVEIFAATSSIGQIQAIDRDNSQWNDFRIKGQTIQIYTNNSERLRIDSSGNFGIGTNSPNFSSFGSNTGGLEISDVNTNNALLVQSGANEFYFANTSSANYIWGDDNVPIIIATNDTERLRIDSSGNMGLGINSPSSRLHVKGAADSYLTLQAGTTDGNDGVLFQNSGGTQKGALLYDTDDNYLLFNVNSAERMRIDSSGDVGIGNDASFPIFTDDRSLLLGAGSGSVGLQIYSSTTGYGGIYFGDTNSGGDRYRGYIEYKHNDDWLRLSVAGQERVRITSAGRMGVGNNNPNTQLHVTSGNSTQLQLQSTGAGSVYLRYQNNDNARGYVGYEGKRLAFYVDNGNNTGDERVAFMDADGLKFFNDTAAANALDDYEEGTFTPTLLFGSSGPTNGYAWRYGTYVKVGRFVHVAFAMGINAGTNPTASAVYFGGLPYSVNNPSHNDHFNYIPIHGYTWNSGYGDSGNVISLFASIRNTYGSSVRIAYGNDKSQASNTQIGNVATRFTCQFTYMAS